MADPGSTAAPLLPLTRLVLALGVALTVGTGTGLWLLADRTADFWAWTIRAPLSAAFLGAGYAGAALGLGLALRSRRWAKARPLVVSALTLTTLSLLATVRQVDDFEFGSDSATLVRVVAWVWLVVYVALPPLLVVVLVLQERAGGVGEHDPPAGLTAVTRRLLLPLGYVLGVAGVLLSTGWSTLRDAWPWPLAPLPAMLVGTWLIMASVTILWVVLRERDWLRARPAAAALLLFVSLLLAAAVRWHNDFDSTAAAVAYVACLLAVLGVVSAVAYREEARLRGEPGAVS